MRRKVVNSDLVSVYAPALFMCELDCGHTQDELGKRIRRTGYYEPPTTAECRRCAAQQPTERGGAGS